MIVNWRESHKVVCLFVELVCYLRRGEMEKLERSGRGEIEEKKWEGRNG